MSIFDQLRALDFHDRTTQLAAVAGVGIAGYVIFKRQNVPDTQANAAASAAANALPDASSIDVPAGNSQNYPGWVGYPDLPSPTPTNPTTTPPPATNTGACPAGKTAVWRDGKLTCMTTSPNTAQQCQPGYTAVKSSAGSRCVKATEWGNTPGPTSYIPTDLTGTYTKGYRGMSQPAPAGAAGEAFLDSWLGRGGDAGPNPYGSVRGFNPIPHPVGAGNYTVRNGDTLASIARRLYGNESFWPQLVSRNGTSAADLQVGSTLKG